MPKLGGEMVKVDGNFGFTSVRPEKLKESAYTVATVVVAVVAVVTDVAVVIFTSLLLLLMLW